MKLLKSLDNVRITIDEEIELGQGKIIDIAVCFDGTWSKRGFTANYGIGFFMSPEVAGKVLDVCVLSKVCEICKQASKLEKNPQKYQEWKRQHKASGECHKNFNGSSSAMEKEAAKILWGRSIKKIWFTIY